MAKEARKSQSSSTSSASNQYNLLLLSSHDFVLFNQTACYFEIFCSRMILRRRQRVVSGEKERSASSARKLSVKHKKKYDKFEAKKPKKPPTAFFYFLYVLFFICLSIHFWRLFILLHLFLFISMSVSLWEMWKK